MESKTGRNFYRFFNHYRIQTLISKYPWISLTRFQSYAKNFKYLSSLFHHHLPVWFAHTGIPCVIWKLCCTLDVTSISLTGLLIQRRQIIMQECIQRSGHTSPQYIGKFVLQMGVVTCYGQRISECFPKFIIAFYFICPTICT